MNDINFDISKIGSISCRDIGDLLMNKNKIEDNTNNNTNNNKECPECGELNFIEDYSKGMIVCPCGQVIDNIYDNGIERRNYDDDGENVRYGIIYNKLLPQSSLGTAVTTRGKLRRLHIWNSMPYKERSDNIMFKRIHEVCSINKIYKKIEDDAKILCKKVSSTVHKTGKNKGKPIITRGYNRSGIVAACLFIACRRNDETRSAKEISSYFGIDERDVNKGLRSLLGILDEDNIVKDVGTSKVMHFISRKCDELQIQKKNTEIAITISKNIEKLNIASNHTTYSLAAASILLMADICGLKSITKKKLSKAFHDLSDVTIGKTYNQIKDLKNILTNNNKVNDILFDINLQKNKKVITKEIWEKMKQFNVDTSKYIVEGNDSDSYYTEDSDSRNNLSDYDNRYFNTMIDTIEYTLDRVRNNIDELKNLDIHDPSIEYIINDINEDYNNIDNYITELKTKLNI